MTINRESSFSVENWKDWVQHSEELQEKDFIKEGGHKR